MKLKSSIVVVYLLTELSCCVSVYVCARALCLHYLYMSRFNNAVVFVKYIYCGSF
jgi:hypothetical protein